MAQIKLIEQKDDIETVKLFSSIQNNLVFVRDNLMKMVSLLEKYSSETKEITDEAGFWKVV